MTGWGLAFGMGLISSMLVALFYDPASTRSPMGHDTGAVVRAVTPASPQRLARDCLTATIPSYHHIEGGSRRQPGKVGLLGTGNGSWLREPVREWAIISGQVNRRDAVPARGWFRSKTRQDRFGT
jgi:hypothetical protein